MKAVALVFAAAFAVLAAYSFDEGWHPIAAASVAAAVAALIEYNQRA